MSILSILAEITVNSSDVHINQVGATSDTITNGLKLVFAVAGAVTVLIITIAGFRYVVSTGNPQETAKAKDAIIYALVGLLICMFAFAITGFVADRL